MENIVIPQLGRASHQFKLVSKNLFNSFYYILDTTGNNGKPIKKLIDRYATLDKPPPFFFAAHNFLVQFFSDEYDDSYLDIFNSIINISELKYRRNMEVIRFNGYEDKKNIDVIEQSLLSDQHITYPEKKSNPDYLLNPCSSELIYLNSEKTLKKAKKIIELVDKEIYHETNFIIDEIRLFSAKNVRAGSGFNTLGMVYISELSKDDDVSRYIEHLIHESAHNLLYAYWANESLIENETNALFYTPFRKDNRPLSAIYHAMFVLCRTIFIFDKINQYDSNLIDFSKVRSNYNEQGNDTPFKEKFYQTIDVISKNAQLSDTGSKIFNGCIDIVNNSKIEI